MSEDRTRFQISDSLVGRAPSRPWRNNPLSIKGLRFPDSLWPPDCKKTRAAGADSSFRFGNLPREEERVWRSRFSLLWRAHGRETRRRNHSERAGKRPARPCIISVVVIPVAQTTVAAPATQESGAAIYYLKSPAMSENSQIRMLPPEAQRERGQRS